MNGFGLEFARILMLVEAIEAIVLFHQDYRGRCTEMYITEGSIIVELDVTRHTSEFKLVAYRYII